MKNEDIYLVKEQYINNLETQIKGLISSLELELQDLQDCREFKKEYVPNSCGIVQSQGRDIDELCIKIGVLRKVIKNDK
jgi:hypothetical protein